MFGVIGSDCCRPTVVPLSPGPAVAVMVVVFVLLFVLGARHVPTPVPFVGVAPLSGGGLLP